MQIECAFFYCLKGVSDMRINRDAEAYCVVETRYMSQVFACDSIKEAVQVGQACSPCKFSTFNNEDFWSYYRDADKDFYWPS